MKLTAVIFDMDGVLVNSEPLWRDAMVEAFKEVGLIITREECAETTGLRIDHVVEYRYEKSPWKLKSKKETVDLILQKLVNLIYEKAEALEGAIDAIHYFRSNGFKIGLATSSPSIILNAILDKLMIRDYFEITNSAENLSFGKPHPEVYINTAQELGVAPTACIAIEDSFNGLLSAKAARMKTIAVPEIENQKNPKFVIADVLLSNLSELSDKHIEILENSLT